MNCLCGKVVLVNYPSQIGRKKYCSKKCFYEYRERPSGLDYNIKVKNKRWFKKGIRNSPETEFKKGQRPHNYNNGIQKTGYGYYSITIPNHPFADTRGRVLLHRFIMEQYLGRYLLPEEIVHHINGIKDDNRIENLKVFENQGRHTTFHLNKRWNNA